MKIIEIMQQRLEEIRSEQEVLSTEAREINRALRSLENQIPQKPRQGQYEKKIMNVFTNGEVLTTNQIANKCAMKPNHVAAYTCVLYRQGRLERVKDGRAFIYSQVR